MSGDPHAPSEQRTAARALLASPLLCRERDPELFALVRRHEVELDRWFSQRLGYRLHLGADTARLYKMTFVPQDRPLRAPSGRPLHQLELVLLLLVLASTVAGPTVISLRDLVDAVRSAAADAGIELTGDATERRALVSALRWMIEQGLAAELHAFVDAYATDATADAVLQLRPDRIAMLALPSASAPDARQLLGEPARRGPNRAYLRARLVEDPVLYRDQLTEEEWAELRRRLGEEASYLEEMFALELEARAEGVAAIDPRGELTDVSFPGRGTEGHAALLLLDALRGEPGRWWPPAAIEQVVRRLAGEHERHWSKDLVAAPERLAHRAVDILVAMGLAQRSEDAPAVRLLPAAARFLPEAPPQATLW